MPDLQALQARYRCFIDVFKRKPEDRNGLPIAVKDVFRFAGFRPSAGVPGHSFEFNLGESTAVHRLLHAGARIVGTTHLSPWCYLPVEDNPHLSLPFNPFGDDLLIGGSSSGSAVAVACKAVAAALGTDTGGSVRIPAALCGVLGFKPSRERIPSDGVVPLSHTNDTVGILAGDITTLRRVFDVLVTEQRVIERNRHDTLSFGIPVGIFDRADVQHRIAGNRLSDALKSLDFLGCMTAPLPLDALNVCASVITGWEANVFHGPSLSRHPEDYCEPVRNRLVHARSITATDYIGAMQSRTELLASVMEHCFARCDVLILPVVNPYALKRLPPAEIAAAQKSALNLDLLSLNRWVNLLGLPAISIPVAIPDAPSASVQIVGRPGEDEGLLDLVLRLGLGIQ